MLGTVLLGLLLALGSTQPAAAHAELIETIPSDGAALSEAPATVELRFSEPVSLIEGDIRLFTDDSGPMPLSATAAGATVTVELPALATDAAHAVAYRVVSADGHPVSGVVTFTVGDAAPGAPPTTGTATPEATELLVRILTGLLYLGLLAFGGLVFCSRVILRPPGAAARTLLLAERWTLGVASVASVLLIPASGLRVVGEGPVSLFFPPAWLPGVTSLVGVAAIVVVVLGWSAHLIGRHRAGGSHRLRDGGSVLLAGLAVLTPTMVGHTLTHNPAVMVLADAGHLLGGGFWVGGLLGMLLFIHSRPGKDSVRGALRRFSTLALWAVVLLVVSGATMAVTVLGSVDQLVGTTYGRLLLVKVLMVTAVVALAAWVRFRLLPTSGSRPKLFRALRFEAALLVAVVLVTGFLANTSPSHSHDHGPQHVRADSQGLSLEGTIAPGVAGPNTLTFTLEFDGAATTDDVEVSFRLPAQDLGPIVAEVEQRADGSWVATANLPVAGAWEAQVAARVSKFERPLAVLRVTIG